MPPGHLVIPGAVLVADVSGFTQLTEQLGSKGPSGVEQLTSCLNSYFAKVGWWLVLWGWFCGVVGVGYPSIVYGVMVM